MLSSQQLPKSLERFLIHIDDDDSPLGEYEWVTIGSSQARGLANSPSTDVLGSLPSTPSTRAGVQLHVDNSDADSIISSATARSKKRQTVRQSILGKGNVNTGEKSSSGKFQPTFTNRPGSPAAFTFPAGIGSPPGSPQRSGKMMQTPSQLLKPIPAVLDSGREWSFDHCYRNLVQNGLSRLGLTFEIAESTDILRKLSWSLLISEMSKLLLRTREVLLEYETQKKEHLAMPQEMLMNIMAMTYQRCATKKFLPYVQHMLPIIEKVMSRPKIGQILREVMLWEKPVEDHVNDYHFESFFREKHIPEFRGIIPSKLKRHHEFMCRWFKSLRTFLRCNRQVMNEMGKMYTLKANTVNPTSKSMSNLVEALAASSGNSNLSSSSMMMNTNKTPQGLFLLSLIKLLNVNTNRAIKNGTTDVNKELLSRLQPAISHISSQSRIDDPIRDTEIMRRANCYAIFHRQLRLAYVQEVEFIHLFRNRKFLTRNQVIYFEEGREKKVITYDRLFTDLQHIHSNMVTAASSPEVHHHHSHHHHGQYTSLIAKIYDFLRSSQELKTASNASSSRSNYAIMITLYMMLVADAMKHPSNAILNVMILDLIMKEKLQWSDAINFSEILAKRADISASFGSVMSAAYAVAAGGNGPEVAQADAEEEEERFVKQVAVDPSHYKILLTMASKTLQIQSKYLGAFFNEISEMSYVYDSILPNTNGNMNATMPNTNPVSSRNDMDPLQQLDPCVELSWINFQLLVEKECLIIDMWLRSEGINPNGPLAPINTTDDPKTIATKQKAALFELMIERITELCNAWYSVDLSDPKIR